MKRQHSTTEIEQKAKAIRRELKQHNLAGPEYLIRSLAAQSVFLEEMEAAWSRGEEVNLEMHQRGVNALVRGYRELGLLDKSRTNGSPRKSKSTEPTDINEYLGQKAN